MTNIWDSNPGGGLQSRYLYPVCYIGETSSSIPAVLCLRQNPFVPGSWMKDFHHHCCCCVMWPLIKQFQAFKYPAVHLLGATYVYFHGKSRHMSKPVSLSHTWRWRSHTVIKEQVMLTVRHSSDHIIKSAQTESLCPKSDNFIAYGS